MLMRITGKPRRLEPRRPYQRGKPWSVAGWKEIVVSKRHIHPHHGHLFEDLRERDQAQPPEPRIDAVETLRRAVDAELFRDVIGDVEYE